MTISALERNPSRAHRSRETARLLGEVAEAFDEAERKQLLDEVIVLNLGVAQAIARRYSNRGIPQDDLEQVAYTALVRAAHKFDVTQERDFLSYAVPTISGEVKRHFRDHGWTIRPPRRIQEIQSRVIHAYKAGHEAGRRPSPANLAEELGLSEDEVREALVASGCFAPTSLDSPQHAEHSGATVGDMLTSDQDAVERAVEARLLLAPALAVLSPRDRRILHARFVEEKTQLEIGDELGITQMQVSRLIKRILRDVRRHLGDSVAVA